MPGYIFLLVVKKRIFGTKMTEHGAIKYEQNLRNHELNASCVSVHANVSDSPGLSARIATLQTP